MPRTFVSRDNELDGMDRLLAEAVAGRGQVCFVTGEAGFGKTTLTAEFARRAQARNADLLVAIGDCNSQTGIGDPYLPFREVLGMLAGDIDDRVAQGMTTEENASRLRDYLRVSKRIIMEVGPDLIDILVPGVGLATKAGVMVAGEDGFLKRRRSSEPAPPDTDTPAGWSRDSDQSRIFEQVTRVLVTLAANRPLILILDDLHWIDDSSAGLLFHLARRIEGSRILIVGTYRPEEVALGRGGHRHPLTQIVPELKRNYGDVIIELGDDNEAEGRRFVDEMIDSQPNVLDREFRRQLFARTKGHPLFTIELLRDMQERGALLKDLHGKWVSGPELDWEQLPARAEGVIEERVNRLPEELRQILTIASVQGGAFIAQIVATILDIDERRILTVLTQELDRKHRLVAEEGTDRVGRKRISRFRFRHQMFESYFYESLGMSERELLHEDIAGHLETLYAERIGPAAVQLAHHFEQAGLAERAAEYYLRAGQRAMRMYASHEAATLALKGLECHREAGLDAADPLRFDLELLLGEAQLNAGRITEAMTAFRSTAEKAIANGVAEVAAKAAIGYTEPRWRYNMVDAMALKLLTGALRLFGEEDSALRARLLASIARASEGLRPVEELLAILDESVAMARRLGQPGVLLDCARFCYSLDQHPARVHDRLALARELLELGTAVEDKGVYAQMLWFHCNDCAAVGDVERWRYCHGILEELADTLGDPFYTYNAQTMRVPFAINAGGFAEAEALAMQAFETGRRLGVENVEGVMGMQMFTLRREQGRLGEVAPIVRHFVDDRGTGAAWRPGLGLIYADLGQLDEARREFDDIAAGNFAIVPRDSLWQISLCYLADVCVALGDRDRGRELYEFLLPYQALTVGNSTASLGATARYLGQLAAMLGEVADAERHLEFAIGLDHRMNATPWLAHSRAELARLLWQHEGPEHRRRAAVLAAEARAVAEELGMARLLARLKTFADD